MTVTMTGPTTTEPSVSAVRPKLLSRPLGLFFCAVFGATTSIYLLLSVVPRYATEIGAGSMGAGLATGALMFATVGAELATPRLTARYGYRLIFGLGLLLLAAPAAWLGGAAALAGPTGLTALLAASLVRGLGFGIVVVVGSALAGTLVPAARRGEGLGLYGIVVGVPAVLALPLGLWLSGRVGYRWVFLAAALAALLGLAATPALPGRAPAAPAASHAGMLAALRNPRLARPALAFGATALATGVVITFVPLAVTRAAGTLAALALLVQAATATLARWWAGRFGDRNGPARLFIPGVLVAGAGMLVLAWTGSPVAVLVGMAVFGTGFGVSQSASLALMFGRVPVSGYGSASAVWNLAYDLGMGIGGVALAGLVAGVGYPLAFALCGAVVLSAALVVERA